MLLIRYIIRMMITMITKNYVSRNRFDTRACAKDNNLGGTHDMAYRIQNDAPNLL